MTEEEVEEEEDKEEKEDGRGLRRTNTEEDQ